MKKNKKMLNGFVRVCYLMIYETDVSNLSLFEVDLNIELLNFEGKKKELCKTNSNTHI